MATRTATLPPLSQTTASSTPDIGLVDFSTKVECHGGEQIAVDRTMFWTGEGAPSPEGHSSIGTTTPSETWYLPEGSSARGFTTYVLVQNPNNSEATVTLTYMTPDGEVPQPPFTMGANSRRTIRVNDALPSTDLSTQVSADRPIIAERAMYWGAGTGEAMHDSIGLDSPHTSFMLPDGQTEGGFETYTLVQNPNPASVTVRITYLPPGGGTPVTFTDEVPANTRRTYSMADKGTNGRASILVQSLDGARPVIVECAMYWNSRGAGTDTIGGYRDRKETTGPNTSPSPGNRCSRNYSPDRGSSQDGWLIHGIRCIYSLSSSHFDERSHTWK